MKKFHVVRCVLLAAATMLTTACLKDNDGDTTLYNDAAITSFTLGTLNQYAPNTDSVIAKITGSNYKMIIKQTEQATAELPAGFCIFNPDSLPYGTRINSVICSVSSLNSGGVAIKNTTDDLFQWYSSSEGIDFANDSTTRIFRVFSTDGTYQRDYRVTLNVCKRDSQNIIWQSVGTSPLLAGFANARILALGNVLVVMGEKGTTTEVVISTDGGQSWTAASAAPALDQTAWASAFVMDDMAYVISGGQLYTSTDGSTWTSDASASVGGLKKLIGAGTAELYALTADSVLKVSTDKGKTWADDKLSTSLSADSVKQLLGMTVTSFVCYPFAASDSTDYSLLVGNNGQQTMIWRKICRYGGGDKGGQWVNIPMESINYYQLPVLSRLSMVALNDAVLAYGTDVTPYQSTDQGITWRSKSTYQLPEQALTVGKDAQNVLWAVTAEGKVWQSNQ